MFSMMTNIFIWYTKYNVKQEKCIQHQAEVLFINVKQFAYILVPTLGDTVRTAANEDLCIYAWLWLTYIPKVFEILYSTCC